MSRLRAESITDKAGTGAPDFPNGLTASGAVSIAGTITYEDVTNIDSVGVVTARLGVIATAGRGVEITAGGLNVTAGIATFKGIGNFDAEVTAAGGVDVAGGVKVGAALTVLKEVTAAGGVDVTGGVKVGAALTVVGALDVDGATTLDAVTIAETATFSNPVKIGTGVTVDTVGFSTFSKGMKIGGGNILQEKAYVNSTAWSASVAAGDINLDLGMVHLNTAVLAGTGNTLNITSAVGINTQMAVGDVIAVTGITSVSATTAFVNTLKIDHSTVQVAWSGGSVPSAGSSTGYDVYAFNIIKTASAKYAVIGNQIKAG